MKKLFLLLILPFIFISCTSEKNYNTISETQVDGYYIYEYDHSDFFCKTPYEDIYYSDATYNYGFSFLGCSADMSFFIDYNDEYIYLKDALNRGLISMESLMPLMERFDRESEDIDSDEADYHWLGFYINGSVVYAYSGGDCGQESTEIFMIDGEEYGYTASGCLKEHILYMQVDREYVSVAELLANDEIDGNYLIPLLSKLS